MLKAMSKIKVWLGTLFTGILGSILASIIITSIPLLIAGIYAFYQNIPQRILMIVLAVLISINYLATFLLFQQQRSLRKSLQDHNLLHSNANISKSGDDISKYLSLHANINTDTRLRDVFQLNDREFIEGSSPQKIILHFTNKGNDIIRIKEVRLSLYASNGLTASDVSSEYRVGKKGRLIIPFDPSEAEMLPGKRFSVIINLAKRWDSKNINLLFGRLASLYIDLVYKDDLKEDEFISF